MITQGVSRVLGPLLSSKHEMVGIIESATRDRISGRKVSLYGIAKYLYSFFFEREPIVLKAYARKKKIPYRYMLSSQDEKLECWIKNLRPDLIVVHSMSQLLGVNIYEIPKYGAINIHPSMLPEYRGPNPDFWQYVDMEENPGVTIHCIDNGEDTGLILKQCRVNIPVGTKSPERLDILIGQVGAKLLIDTIDQLAAGTLNPAKQPKCSPTLRARNLKQEEHNKIIDWENWEIRRIWNVLRGTESWLNALEKPRGIYTGQRWVVGDYHIDNSQFNMPGSIYKVEKKHRLATKDGYIELSLKFSVKQFFVTLLKNK